MPEAMFAFEATELKGAGVMLLVKIEVKDADDGGTKVETMMEADSVGVVGGESISFGTYMKS